MTTIIPGFDCGAPLIAAKAQALFRDGKRFGGRYLTIGDDWRTLHLPEVELMHRAGLSVIILFQHRNDTPGRLTAADGQRQAEAAIRRARALKVPPGVGIYFAHDTDVTVANQDAVLEYGRRVWDLMKNTPWLTGWYGDDRILKVLLENLDAGHLAMLANARGWREPGIDDLFDILQLPQRTHPCGQVIDDCEIHCEAGDERSNLVSVGAWLPA